jgi:CheY-like chemotaxis protein
MKILLIEDDNNKMRRIAGEIQTIRKDVQIIEARSYQSGVMKIMAEPFDLILLDMSLPVFDMTQDEDGYQVDPFSGRNILAEMSRKGIRIPTIVITMFETFGENEDVKTLEELNGELNERFPEFYRGAIYYNSSEITWREQLKKALCNES